MVGNRTAAVVGGVDFEEHLADFYFDACGFTPTNAGLIELRDPAR